MDNLVKIEGIISQVKKLDYNTRLYLLEKLIKLLKNPEKATKPSANLSDLKGMGADIWKNIDIDEYVRQERQWD